MTFQQNQLIGELTPVEAREQLKKRIGRSTDPNEWALQLAIKDPDTIRSNIDVGMYLAACTAFERFVLDITGDDDPRGTFRHILKAGPVGYQDAYEFEAYWAIRDALVHFAGKAKPLNIWCKVSKANENIRKARAKPDTAKEAEWQWERTKWDKAIDFLNSKGFNPGTDIYDANFKFADLWWQGLISFINSVLHDNGLDPV